MNIFIALLPRVKEQINEIKYKIKTPKKLGREFFLLSIFLLLVYSTFKGTLFLSKTFTVPFFPLNFIFTILFALILFSGAIISINEFFVSNDLNIFLSSPIKNINFYIGKILLTIFSASWMPLSLLIPSLVAFGLYYNQGVLYYTMLPIVLIPILAIPIFIGNIFVFIFSKLIPIKVFKEVLFFFYITMFLLIGILIKKLFVVKFTIEGTNLPNTMPFHKVANILNNILLNKEFLYNNLLNLYLITLTLFLISFFIFKKTYFETLSAISSFSSSKTIILKPLENFCIFITSFLGITRQQIFFKEYKTFLRNLGQASQVFLLLGIVFLYFSNLTLISNFSNINNGNFLMLIIISLGVCSFILIAFCSRFVYPSLSLESKAYDIFLKSPTDLKLIYNSKKIFWIFFLIIISLVVFVSTAFVLNLPLNLILLSVFCALILPYGLINVSLLTSSYFLKLNWKNPYELCSSIGSLACMLSCICYLIISSIFVYTLQKYIHFNNLYFNIFVILSLLVFFNILLSKILTYVSIRKLKEKVLL